MNATESNQGFAELLPGESFVERLSSALPAVSIDTVVRIVSRRSKQHVTWRCLGNIPTVLTTGDVEKVKTELKSVLHPDHFVV